MLASLVDSSTTSVAIFTNEKLAGVTMDLSISCFYPVKMNVSLVRFTKKLLKLLEFFSVYTDRARRQQYIYIPIDRIHFFLFKMEAIDLL